VSSFDNNSDEHKTPLPLELNPLTSPLLSKNMDRWAEVYFSGPPEKREQAIEELLRELGGDPTAADKPAAVAGEQASRGTEEILTTPTCGREAAPEPTSDTERLLAPILGSNHTLGWGRGEQPIAPDPSRLFLDHPSTHRRNGVLTTAALAILVGTLFYVGCRETTAWLRVHAAPRSAAPETRSATARQSAPPAAAWPGTSGAGSAVGGAAGSDRAASSTRNGASSSKPDTGANPALGVPSAAASSPKKESPFRTPPYEKPNGASTIQAAQYQTAQNQTAQNSGPGAEELAKAESYLNGTRGKPRDSGEAANWLWKSVAKQNAVATMLLSDLYVRGEGVPKNCDQARLLLNAAARKGVPGAGERIRNLPSVGCP